MNVLNRIIVVLLVVISIFACWAVSLSPITIFQKVGGDMVSLGNALEAFRSTGLRVLAGVALAMVWTLLCLIFLVLQFYRPKPKAVRVDKVGGGEVQVSLKTISDRIAYDIDQLPGVVRVRPKVSAQRGGVAVEVAIETAGKSEVPEQAARIVDMIRESVEERVGVKLSGPPRVKLHAAPVPVVIPTPVPAPVVEKPTAPEPAEPPAADPAG
ncbi:MAG: alkaline shock response membrane anchor protein AmaP [Anaerolineae bacterium]|nr:alkaline shock response membrane anchor protein AmaP [Anaerolineae bacterium]